MALTPEQNAQIKALLPEGFEIVETAQLNTIIEQNSDFKTVFTKLRPVFEAFGGHTDIMTALPQLMPVIATLQTDAALSAALTKVIKYL